MNYSITFNCTDESYCPVIDKYTFYITSLKLTCCELKQYLLTVRLGLMYDGDNSESEHVNKNFHF